MQPNDHHYDALRAIALATVLVSSLLSACTKEAEPQRPADRGMSSQDPASLRTSDALGNLPNGAPATPLPQGDKSTPVSAFVKLASGTQLMNLYHGVAKLPPDVPAIAAQVSADYRNTNDQFRRKDLLAILEPRIRADIADAAAHRYVIWEVTGMPVEHYAADEHRFPIKRDVWNGDSRFYWNDNPSYQISFLGDEPLHGLTVTDEATARAIEDSVSKLQPLRLRIYAFAQDVDLNQKLVRARMLKVELVDEKGKVLAVQAG